MTCEDAAEFVSALHDGEPIPQTPADHIRTCSDCQQRLHAYRQIGTDLRQMAAHEHPAPTTPPAATRRALGSLWQASRQTTSIPRLALASLLILIAVLASSLALVSVRARAQGSAVLLHIRQPSGFQAPCSISAEDPKWQTCYALIPQNANTGLLRYEIKFLSKDHDGLELGIRAAYSPHASDFTVAGIEALPQQRYRFEPGQPLQVPVAGRGDATITGEWIDHVFPVVDANRDLDPGPQELRLYSPILLKDNQVVGNNIGALVAVDQARQAILLFLPGQGRFEISSTPLPGAVQAQAQFNRLSFTLDGQPYAFVTGAPITRSDHVWVQHDAHFQPSGEFEFKGTPAAYIGPVNLQGPAPGIAPAN